MLLVKNEKKKKEALGGLFSLPWANQRLQRIQQEHSYFGKILERLKEIEMAMSMQLYPNMTSFICYYVVFQKTMQHNTMKAGQELSTTL